MRDVTLDHPRENELWEDLAGLETRFENAAAGLPVTADAAWTKGLRGSKLIEER